MAGKLNWNSPRRAVYLISLLQTFSCFLLGWPFIKRLGAIIFLSDANKLANTPDKPFRNFRSSRPGDRRVLNTAQDVGDWFWSSKIVNGFVGHIFTGLNKRMSQNKLLNRLQFTSWGLTPARHSMGTFVIWESWKLLPLHCILLCWSSEMCSI